MPLLNFALQPEEGGIAIWEQIYHCYQQRCQYNIIIETFCGKYEGNKTNNRRSRKFNDIEYEGN